MKQALQQIKLGSRNSDYNTSWIRDPVTPIDMGLTLVITDQVTEQKQ